MFIGLDMAVNTEIKELSKDYTKSTGVLKPLDLIPKGRSYVEGKPTLKSCGNSNKEYKKAVREFYANR